MFVLLVLVFSLVRLCCFACASGCVCLAGEREGGETAAQPSLLSLSLLLFVVLLVNDSK